MDAGWALPFRHAAGLHDDPRSGAALTFPRAAGKWEKAADNLSLLQEAEKVSPL